MESNHISSDIYLGYALYMGKVAIKCTADHLWIYQYQTCCPADRLQQFKWDSFKEIRLNAHDGEVKFTMRSNIPQIRIWLDSAQGLISEMEFLERIVKIRKWKPNGMSYYEPQAKKQAYEFQPITVLDFIEQIANGDKCSTVIPRRFKKKSACLTAFFDHIF